MANKVLKGTAISILALVTLAAGIKFVGHSLDVSDANDLCNNVSWRGTNVKGFQVAVNDALDDLEVKADDIDEDGIIGGETRKAVVVLFSKGYAYKDGQFLADSAQHN